ncbi:hypothetical protein GCM10029964_004990 [Kibdelosporangium lantanae]
MGIAGFNYPLLLAAHKIAPAIAAGCPVVCKPAPSTPLATLWLVHIVREAAVAAGAPAAIAQLVTGDVEVGSTLVTDRRIGAVSFTGSAAVGHQIAKVAAPTKTLLELGSNAALVVAEDADLDAAVDAVLRGGFYASGQACISVQRLLVSERIVEQFTQRLIDRLAEVIVGDPRDEATRVSALIDERSTNRVLRWIEESGGRVLTGGGLHGGGLHGGGLHGGGRGEAGRGEAGLAGAGLAGGGLDEAGLAEAGLAGGRRDQGGASSERGDAFQLPPGAGRVIRPTVLADVPEDAACWAEEVFGPVVVLRTVSTVEEAFDLVNASRYGLHAAVFTRSLATAFQAVDALEVGGVIVNEVPGFRSDTMPYGGVKDSGIGREGPRFAVEELTVTRMAVIRPA